MTFTRTTILAAALCLAGCSQTLPEGWDSVETVKAGIGHVSMGGDPDNPVWQPQTRVSVSAPLSCAAGQVFDPTDSFEALRQQASHMLAPDGLTITFLRPIPSITASTVQTYLAQQGIASNGHGMTEIVSSGSHSHHDITIAAGLSPQEERDAALHELGHVFCPDSTVR